MMETKECENHPKRNKSIFEEDYVSLLPDCLLIDIISRLPETKEAIRTGTLSKRWQHLWPYVDNLIFINNNDPNDIEFVSFVDKTLTQCHQSTNLHKFQIRNPLSLRGFQFQSQFSNWIRYAVSRDVQDLQLELTGVVVDESMYINSCFTSLKLECELNPTGAVSWSNLRSLSVTRLDNLTEDSIQNILSGSPLLETLEFKYCYGFSRIDITSKSVKNFLFSGHTYRVYNYEDSDNIIEINAPYIVSLKITYGLTLPKLLLVDVSCLVKAHLDYIKYGDDEPECDVSHEATLKGFILSLRHVKELKIGKSCIENLARLEAEGFIFPSNMEHPVLPDHDSSKNEDWSDNDSTEIGDL